MPMCMAMLQNHAKNITCQNVNFTRPASGAPPFQITSFAAGQNEATESTPISCRPASPNAMKTRTIHGAAMLAIRATTR